MPLKINLKPAEKMVINGAVIVNGDRRTNILVQNKASILREKDILQPEDVTTPARHIYFHIMMLYLDPEGREEHYRNFVVRMSEFLEAMRTPAGIELCVRVSRQVTDGNYYLALSACRKLLEYESERLGESAATKG